MNYRPIGLSHGEWCDSDDPAHWCDSCQTELNRQWAVSEGDER